jgi:hypothetical protein
MAVGCSGSLCVSKGFIHAPDQLLSVDGLYRYGCADRMVNTKVAPYDIRGYSIAQLFGDSAPVDFQAMQAATLEIVRLIAS